MQATNETQPAWLNRPLFTRASITWETLLWITILVLAVFTRFYILGARVMSHDENSHVYYSWRFFKGQGFQHDPLMHGPFQFHAIALTYFMFGDNDFTARTPAALFSIAAVMFMWFYRRYLGRAGALVGGVLMLISPYILFYGRYARNEAFIELFGVAMLWGILRYLETGLPRYMYVITLANVMHFTSKETSFIYTAQALIFLAALFIYRVSQSQWPNREYRNRFLLALMAALLLLAAIGAVITFTGGTTPTTPVAPPAAEGAAPAATSESILTPPVVALGILFGVAVMAGLYFLVSGYTLDNLRRDRPFSAMIVMLTLVLPQLAAFPVRLVGWKIPTNASEVASLTMADMLHIAAFLIPIALLSIVVGLLWNPREWLVNAAIWYSLFTIFYTSTFTNGAGFFTGLVGSLGYWLEQQGVERGNQPWYYYGLIQVPVYEFLPMLGTWLAFGLAIFAGVKTFLLTGARRAAPAADYGNGLGEEPGREGVLESASQGLDSAVNSRLLYPPARDVSAVDADEDDVPPAWEDADEVADEVDVVADDELQPAAEGGLEPAPVFALFGFWAVSSLLAYSYAGEKMPWLTVHITLPAILATAWALGRLIDGVDWGLVRRERGWLVVLLLPVFFLSFFMAAGSLLGNNPPFRGQELVQLQDTSTFLLDFLAAVASGVGLAYLIRRWPVEQFLRLLTLAFFALLAALTTRTAVQANYYAYDNANELLVYAHAAPGVKTALAQIEEISQRTTDGLAIAVAYDNETSYPYWWYLRNYPNQNYFGANPSRALRDKPVILVGDANFGKIEPVVANQYERFDYIRLWWPNQDYFDLSWDRIREALSKPAMRDAMFQIWLNRDYTRYGTVTGRDMSLPNWSPAARMRLYVRKDIAAKIWNYGAAPTAEASSADPFEGKVVTLEAVKIIGQPGNQAGQFQRPRDMAVAEDGSLYVVDADNNRIQHLTAEGEVLQVWGSFGDVAQGQAQGGQFNQPWGIGLSPDGSVYVADTWNHRVQKFTADGQFVTMWGLFGQGEQPQAFWGPRDVAVDAQGRVYVTDTGNKRVVVFDANGAFITQFGEAGLEPGQFDEPVGLAIGPDGRVYVADTWNQRVQVFQADESGVFQPFRNWEVPAWYGQSLDNKPYLAVDNTGMVFIADPEGYRILQFTSDGQPVRAWGDFGAGADTFGMPASVAVAPNGGVWVVDAGNSRVMLFSLPR